MLEHAGRRTLLVTVLCLAVVAGSGIGVGRSVLFGSGVISTGGSAGVPAPSFAPSNFGLFWDALRLAQQHFVEHDALKPENLTYGAIRGMIDALGDPGHSEFLTPDEVKSEQDALNGSIIGIGVVMTEQAGQPSVVSVISGSPAARAGIQPGDEIVAIDGTAANTLSVPEIVKRVRGPAGTKVTLTVIHPGSASPVDISIIREQIDVPAVDWTLVPGTQTADIRVGEFSKGAADEFAKALKAAQAAGATSLVLDLRNDPGGYVDEAVGIVSRLVSKGNVYLTRDASGKQTPVPVRKVDLVSDLPLVVLVDFGTASSAEIVAGALQDAGRATILGTRTFGTGTVLNTFMLSDGSAINLGVEEWLTPAGHRIFPNGIAPTEIVNLPLGTRPLEPDQIRPMSPAQVRAASDTQLDRALQKLEAGP